VLRKRENFRRAFAGFQMERVARFTPRKVESLLQDEGIIRHRGKIESAIQNARRACELVEERGSLSNYLWSFEPPVTERPERITLDVLRQLTESPTSRALSKDLKRRGWSFVGPTTMYALLQAMGMVNDHLHGCDVRAKAERARKQPVEEVP
jgi:DNA-3-methyladenine glycosylase I